MDGMVSTSPSCFISKKRAQVVTRKRLGVCTPNMLINTLLSLGTLPGNLPAWLRLRTMPRWATPTYRLLQRHEKYRDTPPPFLFLSRAPRCYCKSMPSSWQKVVYTPPLSITMGLPFFGNGPNTVSGSTVSNTELSEVFGAH